MMSMISEGSMNENWLSKDWPSLEVVTNDFSCKDGSSN